MTSKELDLKRAQRRGQTYPRDQLEMLTEIAYQLAVFNDREALKQLKTHLNPESEWGGDNEVTSGN